MTSEQLDEIENRAKAATRGPWDISRNAPRSMTYYISGPIGKINGPNSISDLTVIGTNDAEFIANARDDVPALIAALREAWARTQELEGEMEHLAALAMNEATDADWGRRVRLWAEQLELQHEEAPTLAFACGRIIIGMAVKANATKCSVDVGGFSYNGVPHGDWVVRINRNDLDSTKVEGETE